ncbi:MAG: autotransporter domain-containing protein [Elusimicrobia bacterium]|nr:autotransporter domain-containing protein [Elusimicrobiota bacterium]
MTLANTSATLFTINSAISGLGSLTQSGSGTAYLTGSNSYTGGTFFNGGTLKVNSDAALGSTTGGLTFNGGTLQAGASLTSARSITLNGSGTFDPNGYTSALTGVVSGAGSLVVAGTGGGILDLRNVGNTYSGGTFLNSGTLSINNDAALGTGGLTFNGGTLQTGASLTDSRSINLNGAGTIDTAGTASTLAGLISGGGSLTKISSGTLTLTGSNTYTGGTNVNGGVLAVSNDANLGGSAGGLELNGGTLQTTGAVNDGRTVTLGSSGGTIDTHGNNDAFSGQFTGAGSLTKIGAGILNLANGTNNYTGGTYVNVGTLQMGAGNAMPTGGALNIAGGATFDMNGFSQTNTLGNVVNNGLFNVGSRTLALGSGSTYSGTGTLAMTLGTANLTTGTNTPKISGGNITLTNTTLSVSLNDPGVKNNDTFAAISGTSLSGPFANILSPAAINFTQNPSGGILTLTAHLVPFANLAATPNQSAIGGALESLRTQAQANPTGAAAGVIANLYSLNVPQIQAAFDQIGPIALAPMTSLGLAGSSVEAEALGRRMTALDSGADTGGVSLGSVSGASAFPGSLVAEGGVGDADPFSLRLEPADAADEPWGFFVSGLGTTGHLSSMSGAAGAQPGYDYMNGGVVLGGDYKIADGLAVGLSAGYLHGQANVYTNASSFIDDDSARAGVYATGRRGPWRADLYAGGALDFFTTSRGILVNGTSASAVGSPTGHEFNGNGDVSYDVPTTNWGVLSPFAGLNNDRLAIHSFNESGAGAMNLNVGNQSDQSLRSSLGLRESFKTVSEGLGLESHLSLGWVHEFMSQSRPIDAQLASGAGSVFAVQTADLPRDGALAGVGVVIILDQDKNVNLDYTADVRPGFMENVFNATLRVMF